MCDVSNHFLTDKDIKRGFAVLESEDWRDLVHFGAESEDGKSMEFEHIARFGLRASPSEIQKEIKKLKGQ